MRSWGEIEGRLILYGSAGILTLDMPVNLALNLMYAFKVEGLTSAQREELDDWLGVTAEGLAEFEQEERQERQEQRMGFVAALGGDVG